MIGLINEAPVSFSDEKPCCREIWRPVPAVGVIRRSGIKKLKFCKLMSDKVIKWRKERQKSIKEVEAQGRTEAYAVG
ncbi:MAG: hypothetical protein HQK96_21225 [Nitrospirae bacterium]|nr:hypothetical protein [Nitrospirota bacterium]